MIEAQFLILLVKQVPPALSGSLVIKKLCDKIINYEKSGKNHWVVNQKSKVIRLSDYLNLFAESFEENCVKYQNNSMKLNFSLGHIIGLSSIIVLSLCFGDRTGIKKKLINQALASHKFQVSENNINKVSQDRISNRIDQLTFGV